MTRVLAAIALAAVCLLFVAGCSCGPTVASCVPGQSVACVGATGCPASQVCSADGAFGACTCTQEDAGTSGDAGPPGDAGTDGGATLSCAGLAQLVCTEAATCTPTILKAGYEDMMTCLSVIAQGCATAIAKGDNGVVDATSCQATQSASCDAYFSAQLTLPAPCKRKLGSVAVGGRCFFDSQCGAGAYCASNTVNPGCQGLCTAVTPSGSSCVDLIECDRDNGVSCAATFVPGTPPTNDGVPVCQQVTYGGLGAACVPGTNRVCANGFECANGACAAILAATAACQPAASLCDARRGESCQVDPSAPANHVCTPLHVASIGAQCGSVGVPPVTYVCSGHALCNAGTPSVCAARVLQGLPCTQTPDNCAPGLMCTAGTCQAPAPPTCP